MGASVASSTVSAQSNRTQAMKQQKGTIDKLEFDSISSMLDSSYNELKDDDKVAVWLEDTATNVDRDGNGDAVEYSDSTKIPVVAVDGNVVGFSGMIAKDGTSWHRGNEEFLLNVWDEHVGGGKILWDEGHGQSYKLDEFSSFRSYAEDNGYTVRSERTIENNLQNADGVVITSPSRVFDRRDLEPLIEFVKDGGTVFLHDQSDYKDLDETANLNNLAYQLNAGFRFNNDQALDEVMNAGDKYRPVTDEFNTSKFNYFADRSGIGLDKSKTYEASVTDVIDGDTIEVEFKDGTKETVRMVGIDAPELKQNSDLECVHDWEGIELIEYLQKWGDRAENIALQELLGETVELSFDPEVPVRDYSGNLLAYVSYDSGSGKMDTLYNLKSVEDGYARVYGSGFSRHDEFWEAENRAQNQNNGMWKRRHSVVKPSEMRNRDVKEVFFPRPSSIRTEAGKIDEKRVVVSAQSSAFQTGNGLTYKNEIPLVAVDETRNIGAVGGPFIDESYEKKLGFSVDTSPFENFVLQTNLIDYLSAKKGDVLIDGGHGQFEAGFSVSNEDAAYYQRYLEGVDIDFEQVNDITQNKLARGRALIITTPTENYSGKEIRAVESFIRDGGAVILMGSGRVTDEARNNLNSLASQLNTDLRINEDMVLDKKNNVDGDPEIPATSSFNTSYPLFGTYDGSLSGGSPGKLVIDSINPDPSGKDWSNLNDEYVVFKNTGGRALDLSGWKVENKSDQSYTFPSGFSLGSGDEIKLHTGSGSDSSTDLYWGSSSPIWTNAGNEVKVYDDKGQRVTSKSYGQGSLSIEDAIANLDTENDKIEFTEIQKAIQFWSQDKQVPGTNKKISFSDLQKLISIWSKGGSV